MKLIPKEAFHAKHEQSNKQTFCKQSWEKLSKTENKGILAFLTLNKKKNMNYVKPFWVDVPEMHKTCIQKRFFCSVELKTFNANS